MLQDGWRIFVRFMRKERDLPALNELDSAMNDARKGKKMCLD